MIEYQLPRGIMKYSKCISNPPFFLYTCIILFELDINVKFSLLRFLQFISDLKSTVVTSLTISK